MGRGAAHQLRLICMDDTDTLGLEGTEGGEPFVAAKTWHSPVLLMNFSYFPITEHIKELASSRVAACHRKTSG